MNNNYIIASNRIWGDKLYHNICKRSKYNFELVKTDKELIEKSNKLNPKIIFFVHWSSIIKEEIYKKYECIVFHMTDLPFGKGGSPLQNLIIRKIYKTKISAIRCIKEIDAGPIYLKKELSLYGSAEEIYNRSSDTILKMILEILNKKILPYEQEKSSIKETIFKRRTKDEGDLKIAKTLNDFFDMIRMLDAEDYPNAFIEFGNFKLEFSRASLKTNNIIADVKISLKES